jgi:hypothetical protein
MDSSKEELEVKELPAGDVQFEDNDGLIPSRYRGTDADKRDMMTLGKKQVLRVSEDDACTRFS